MKQLLLSLLLIFVSSGAFAQINKLEDLNEKSTPFDRLYPRFMADEASAYFKAFSCFKACMQNHPIQP